MPHGVARLLQRAWGKLLAGRDFNDADRADGDKVVIVSESLARRMLPSWTPSTVE